MGIKWHQNKRFKGKTWQSDAKSSQTSLVISLFQELEASPVLRRCWRVAYLKAEKVSCFFLMVTWWKLMDEKWFFGYSPRVEHQLPPQNLRNWPLVTWQRKPWQDNESTVCLWRVIMCFYLFDVSMVFLRKAPLFCPRENEVGSEPSRSLGVAMISMMEVWMPLMAWGDELGIRAKLRFLPALVASWGHLEKLWCWWQWGDINIPLVNISQNHD